MTASKRCLWLFAFSLCCVPWLARPAHGGWLAGYDCRQAITIAPSITPGDLTDFPLLVSVANPANEVFAQANSPSGLDVVFTAANGVSVLPREIESYSSAGSQLNAWVKTDVSSTAPTTLYMYYKGGAVANSPGTWDDNFKMVQHLEETTGTRTDSTQYANAMTAYNGVAATTAGKVDGADVFDGIDNGAYLAAPDTLGIGPTQSFTHEAWVNLGDSHTTENKYVMALSGRNSIRGFIGSTPNAGIYWERNGLSAQSINTGLDIRGAWHHVAQVYDATAGTYGTMTMYLDGQPVGSAPVVGATLRTGSALYTVGTWATTYGQIDGTIDEVRISDSPRSAEWMAASYNNQNNPTAHVAAAAAQAKGGWLQGYAYRQEITIDPSATDANLSDFPLLVKITDPANGVFANAVSPAGLDVVFTNGDGQTLLPHEMEAFSKTGSPEMNAWVKTDLSADQPTSIYMYYGGPNAANSYSPDTWDANFRMVQHLEETSGTATDSTQYANHGTPVNGVTQNVPGLLDGGDDFDGIASQQYIAVPDTNFGIDGDEPFTMEAWCRVIDDGVSSQNQYILSKVGKIGVRVLSGGTPDLGLHVEGGSGAYNSIDITDQWHHVAVAYDPTVNNILIYLDGVLVDEAPQSVTLRQGGTYYIGTWTTSYGWVPGTMDEVRISDITRSLDWILASVRLQRSPSDYVGLGAEQIPEPATLSLLGLSTLALLRRRRRR